ncbi:Uncharacterized protein YggT [secondary endosymbiont of Trabutina mannipara]|uniref:Uncharacterized protein YggT n=1 Tax=secondary endosymbiont of Trabutina mannipara TaxID=1835721 RepID=A0A1C3L3Y0_9ENTR|nr:YggT family protein [secondary endosymbiont of Trabutina mannipara]SBT81965.1 Uncharacterized protein YggT [secondary endosymbiont of Trabutina mannipara]
MLIIFFVKTLINLYIMMMLLRFWMQLTHCDFSNTFSQLIVKITQPVIGRLNGIFPSLGNFDSASLIVALTFAMIKLPILTLIDMHVFIYNHIYLLVGLLALLKIAGELVFWIVFIRTLLSWRSHECSHKCSHMDVIIYKLSELLMHPIRLILPDMGGIDFSAMIVIVILYVLNHISAELFSEIWYRL